MDEEEQRIEANRTIDEAVQSIAGAVSQEGAVCTGWVLVSQWSDVEGSQAFLHQASDGMPPWLERGMLAQALGAVEG
jgi:hypothetical protein